MSATVWQVGDPTNEDQEFVPVAAFSKKENAAALAREIHSVEPKEVSGEENTLPVDKFASEIELGLIPFDVLLNPDRSVFETSSFATMSKVTFWGKSLDEAIESAQSVS